MKIKIYGKPSLSKLSSVILPFVLLPVSLLFYVIGLISPAWPIGLFTAALIVQIGGRND